MDSLVIKAYAKINLTLDVIRRREDGYHDVEMIMQQISLHDEVRLTVGTGYIQVSAGHCFVPDDENNIAHKAAKLFFDHTGLSGGVRVEIQKNIPVAAGLAGGSTDAAAVLMGLNKLLAAGLSEQELMVLGARLGADVPFCILGGTCLSQGTGVALTALEAKMDYWVLLVKPPIGVSTKEVYEGLSVPGIQRHPDTARAMKALQSNDLYELRDSMYNVLEEVTGVRYKAISDIKHKLMNFGAKAAMMSGSGPSVFGLFSKREQVERAYRNMKRYYQEVYIARPILGGMRHAD